MNVVLLFIKHVCRSNVALILWENAYNYCILTNEFWSVYKLIFTAQITHWETNGEWEYKYYGEICSAVLFCNQLKSICHEIFQISPWSDLALVIWFSPTLDEGAREPLGRVLLCGLKKRIGTFYLMYVWFTFRQMWLVGRFFKATVFKIIFKLSLEYVYFKKCYKCDVIAKEH